MSSTFTPFTRETFQRFADDAKGDTKANGAPYFLFALIDYVERLLQLIDYIAPKIERPHAVEYTAPRFILLTPVQFPERKLRINVQHIRLYFETDTGIGGSLVDIGVGNTLNMVETEKEIDSMLFGPINVPK